MMKYYSFILPLPEVVMQYVMHQDLSFQRKNIRVNNSVL
jgi:hypothetical protein